MADQVQSPGRLIAIDGTRHKDIDAAAADVIAALEARGLEGAVSRFDASGLFGELAAAGRNGNHLSARTLTLVYAADLAFRLRWEIGPALEAGGIVIAAPYIESAVAIGAANGLDEEWLRGLLRFAIKPNFTARADEKKIEKGWKARLTRGYGEYCAAMLDGGPGADGARKTRKAALARLQRRRGRKVYLITGRGAADLATAVTGSQRAPARRSASEPRSAQKRRARR